jgi:hypothetical protein
MKLLIIVFISGFLAALLFTAGCEVADAPRGKASGAITELDESFLQAYARRMSTAKEHAGRVTPEYVLEHVQNMEALIAEGQARKLDQLPEFRQAVHQFQAELLLRTMQPDLVPEIPRDSITDEDARTFYQENSKRYALPDLYTATLFYTRKEGEALILGAAKDRKALEAEAALLPGVETQTLEPMALERFPGQWAESLRSLELGSCGPVVMHEDRFVVLCLEDVQRDRMQDFEARKKYIRNDVLFARYREAWHAAYAKLRETHGVRVDPGVAQRFTEEWLQEGGAQKPEP